MKVSLASVVLKFVFIACEIINFVSVVVLYGTNLFMTKSIYSVTLKFVCL